MLAADRAGAKAEVVRTQARAQQMLPPVPVSADERDAIADERDVVAAVLPDPATIGPRMTGKTCAGLWVTGTGVDGEPREVYLYHMADNETCLREWGCVGVADVDVRRSDPAVPVGARDQQHADLVAVHHAEVVLLMVMGAQGDGEGAQIA